MICYLLVCEAQASREMIAKSYRNKLTTLTFDMLVCQKNRPLRLRVPVQCSLSASLRLQKVGNQIISALMFSAANSDPDV